MPLVDGWCRLKRRRLNPATWGRGPSRHRQVVPSGPSQAQPCGVVPRPYPGRGSRLSLRENPDAKSRRGFPPAPPGIKPLAGARFLFWDRGAAERSLLFIATHVRALIWKLSFGRIFLAGFFLALSLHPPTLPSPPSRGAGRYGRRSQVCRKKKSPPSPISKNQRRWVQGGGNSSSLVFFPPFLTGEMEAAGRHPPGALRPEAGKSLDHP